MAVTSIPHLYHKYGIMHISNSAIHCYWSSLDIVSIGNETAIDQQSVVSAYSDLLLL